MEDMDLKFSDEFENTYGDLLREIAGTMELMVSKGNLDDLKDFMRAFSVIAKSCKERLEKSLGIVDPLKGRNPWSKWN